MTGRLIALVTLSTLVGAVPLTPPLVGAAPRTPQRAAPTVSAADVLEFRKVDVFVTDENGDEKKKDARLEIDTDVSEIRLVDEKRGATRATYAVIPIDRIAGLVYEAELGTRWGGVVGVRPGTHWLTIKSEALPSGSLRVRLDKDNQRELRFALREATGLIDDLALPE